MANITRLKAMVRTISAVNTPEIHLRLLSLPQEYLSSFKVGYLENKHFSPRLDQADQSILRLWYQLLFLYRLNAFKSSD